MRIKSPGKKKPAAIRPARARYIKLGTGGEWEAECIEKGIIRFGFGSARPDRFPLTPELKSRHYVGLKTKHDNITDRGLYASAALPNEHHRQFLVLKREGKWIVKSKDLERVFICATGSSGRRDQAGE